jgi:hypothetical protein
LEPTASNGSAKPDSARCTQPSIDEHEPPVEDDSHNAALMDLPLGLSLRKTDSLIALIMEGLNDAAMDSAATSHSKPGSDACAEGTQPRDEGTKTGSGTKGNSIEGSSSNNDSENCKLKASNFPVTHLRVGDWEHHSQFVGDLVSKCYFAKRKLVWEILHGGLKSKIEMLWSDISGIEVCTWALFASYTGYVW